MSGATRLSSFLAVLTCLLFCITLPPTRLTPAIFVPFAVLPSTDQPAGALSVRVRGLPPLAAADCLSSPPAQNDNRCQSEPLPGAVVSVLWEQHGSYFPAAAAIADGSGSLQLEGLPQGYMWLLVEAPGFARRGVPITLTAKVQAVTVLLEKANDLVVSVIDDQRQPIPGATVLVSGTDPLPFGMLSDAGGQAAFHRLGRGPWQVTVAARGYEKVTQVGVQTNVSITLRKLGALLITVIDERGQVAPGAQVFVGGALWPPQQGTTDAKGELSIGGLESGSYDLRAVRGQQVSPSLLGLFLARGELARARLQLGPGRFVTVLVQDGETEDARPVADADVVLVEQGIAPFPLQGRTDDQGTVTLGPIAVGPASVGAQAEGFIGRAAVPVPEQLEGPLIVALRRGATLRGKVVDKNDHAISDAEIEVIGTDLDGLPIAETPWFAAMRRGHFEASLGPAAPLIPAGELGVMPGPIPAIPRSAAFDTNLTAMAPIEPVAMGSPWQSDVDGDFRLFPVTPGRVRLLVRHPSYVETISDSVTLEPGGEAHVKVVMLEGATLIGRVLDDRDFPVAGARIELTATRGVSRHSLFTASDGTFEFRAVPSSVVLSLARPNNPVEFVLRKHLELKNDQRQEIEIVLPAERETVELQVSAERQAVDLAQVLFVSLAAETPLKKTLFTDPQGRVVLPDAAGLPLRVQIEVPGFSDYNQTFDSTPKLIEVELVRGVLVQGKVTAIRGRQAVSGASVTVLSQGQRHGTRSDDFGVYEIRDLSPGEATLIISHPEYATHQEKLQITATTRADRPFEIEPIDLVSGGSVQGLVVDEQGNPISGARVAAGAMPAFLPAGELPAGMVKSNAQGEFELLNLEPGNVTIEAQAVGKGRGRASVAVSEGQVARDVRIVMQPAADTETGQTGGVAVTLSEPVAGQVVIQQVAAHSEAERAGLQVGDRLLAVEGGQVTSMSDARSRLSGNAGSDVLIELQRAESIFKLRVNRESLRR